MTSRPGRDGFSDELPRATLIVIACLQEIDSLVGHKVDDSMLLRQTPRPRGRRKVLQWLRLAHSLKWIAKNGFDDLQRPQRNPSIRFYPIAEILLELRLEHCQSIALDPRLLFIVKTQLGAQSREGFGATFAGLCPSKRLHETLRVLGRAQKMCRFDQASQFICRDQSDVIASPAMDDHLFPVLRHFIKQ